MSAQTKYGFRTAAGAAGGIVDLAPYLIDTYLNEEADGKLKFGYGVVRGENGGCKIPTQEDTADKFVGVVTNNRTTEYGLDGKIYIRNKAAIGVMRYGRIYVRVAPSLTIEAGEPAYLIVKDENAGCFTNAKGDGAVAISGAFAGTADTGNVAPVDLYNAPAPAEASSSQSYTLPAATAGTLGGVKVGDGLEVTGDGKISIKKATESELGGVKVGSGLQVDDGTVSVSN